MIFTGAGGGKENALAIAALMDSRPPFGQVRYAITHSVIWSWVNCGIAGVSVVVFMAFEV